eukprot:3689999-Amphidinium_carterae.2
MKANMTTTINHQKNKYLNEVTNSKTLKTISMCCTLDTRFREVRATRSTIVLRTGIRPMADEVFASCTRHTGAVQQPHQKPHVQYTEMFCKTLGGAVAEYDALRHVCTLLLCMPQLSLMSAKL